MKQIKRALKLFAIRIYEELLLKRKICNLYLVLGGHIFFQTLSSAIQFDLFSLLDETGPLTLDQIQEKLNIQAQPCRILLLGLTSLDFLKKSGQHYQNSLTAKIFFTRKSSRNIINIVKWQHFINYQAMYHFHEAIQKNSNVGLKEFPGDEPYLYGRLTHQPHLEAIFQDAMEQISWQASGTLTEYLDLRKINFLVDVGGGNASNLVRLAQANPHLRGGVFESSTVCEIAKNNIAGYGMNSRLHAFPGDCFKDAFPPQADALLFCHFFTIWSLEKNLLLLKRAYDSLPPGGQVIIFNMMQDNDGTGPLSAALGSPYFLTLATGEGMLYSWNEYIGLFIQAGFTNVTTQRLPMSHGIIVGTKP